MDTFNTGDIITARVKSLPLVLHHGIIVNDSTGLIVYHNTPLLKNIYGGNIVVEPLADWLQSRDIVQTEQTEMTKEYIQQTSHDLADRPFNVFSFNCEQYISLLKNGWRESPQLIFWGICLTAFALLRGKL